MGTNLGEKISISYYLPVQVTIVFEPEAFPTTPNNGRNTNSFKICKKYWDINSAKSYDFLRLNLEIVKNTTTNRSA